MQKREQSDQGLQYLRFHQQVSRKMYKNITLNIYSFLIEGGDVLIFRAGFTLAIPKREPVDLVSLCSVTLFDLLSFLFST